MKPINIVNSIYAPLDRKNVDTDQIISKEFLKRIERTGFGEFVFYHWRFDKDGNPNTDFVLNKPQFNGAEILVAQDNFGCGSSREHAPWAILDYGFRVVIAPSFADIFHNNCFKNGILPIKLTEAECDELLEKGLAQAQAIEVNLEAQTVTTSYGKTYEFSMDPYYKEMLLNGWDEISLTFKYDDQIAEYEKNRIAY
ncbi:3-isopropylmalate dehydratase small subunit [Lysinibacillus sp. 2017]|uniref:3-isopropylmalate dehydratase small subunit n=1 Tax=unclassified Lysinibacillus TaxID=2636778 RepID=UPI000D527EE0|nr:MULTISPECIES: 3-isopropylmalate dehydratase small subunit [unclassified Lysinibacillus]AWE07411.1 3-isopropylmalate dehydratase small subunit [Lysinibacillus sp. 2017]TGN36575.1 3-isopropylmalate dehydratase small subunit [Lysinibacillus sp. S2017]